MSAHKQNIPSGPHKNENTPGADCDIALSGPDWDMVLDSMERPPQANTALKAVLQEYDEAVASGKLEAAPS
ncbi:MAG: type II toxin-antitoxin system TacA family antitoxin [Rhodospirillales bacterium]